MKRTANANPNSGFVKLISVFLSAGSSFSGATPLLIMVMPIIMTEKPKSTRPILRLLSDFENIVIATDTIARIGEKLLGLMIISRNDWPSNAFKDSIHAVAVVPSPAPISNPIA